MQISFSSDQVAAFALLKDATNVLSECGVDFAVVGGWVPYLFHSHLFGHASAYDLLKNAVLCVAACDKTSACRRNSIGFITPGRGNAHPPLDAFNSRCRYERKANYALIASRAIKACPKTPKPVAEATM